jgi:hypothetical protein
MEESNKLLAYRNGTSSEGRRDIHNKTYHDPNVSPFMARIVPERSFNVVCSLDILTPRNRTNSRAYAVFAADIFVPRNCVAWNERCAKVMATSKLFSD